jgi:hypothetical protein
MPFSLIYSESQTKHQTLNQPTSTPNNKSNTMKLAAVVLGLLSLSASALAA